MIAFDEFALTSRPDTHYAWAEKNTAPRIPSDERRRQRITGFLGVDLQDGETRVQFQPGSQTDDVVWSVAMIVLLWVQQGYRWITLILDNAPTHREGMKQKVHALLAQVAEMTHWDDLANLTLNFLHPPAYSPDFNPAEYLIHAVRQGALYHAPSTLTLAEKAGRVRDFVERGPPMTPVQMARLLDHVYRLPGNGQKKYQVKLE